MNNHSLKQKILRWFSELARLKPQLHFSEGGAFPKKREIWWVSLGHNIGVETSSKRFRRLVGEIDAGEFDRIREVVKDFL